VTTPEWLESASPGVGRPLITAVERHAAPLRGTIAELKRSLDVSPSAFEAVWGPRRDGLGFRVGADAADRAARCLVAEWLVGYAAGVLRASDTVADAHAWFTSDAVGSAFAVPGVLPYDAKPPRAVTVAALLPYLLEFTQQGTRRQVRGGAAPADVRRARKSAGVFLTPADVAQVLVGEFLARRGPGCRWIDPAAGPGVLLRHVRALDPTAKVYGIDIDSAAAEMASFTLLATDPTLDEPFTTWHTHRARYVSADALLCEPGDGTASSRGGWRLGSVFPELAHGVDVVVQNPPYAPCPEPTRPAATARFGSAGNMYPLFLRLGLALLGEHGSMSAVVPASIVTGGARSIRDAREALADAAGSLEIRSYDRAPDALFGDDVKTRCSIVLLERAATTSVRIGPMVRLTSRDRTRRLGERPAVAVPISELRTPNPAKVGTAAELPLLAAVRSAQSFVNHHCAAVTPAVLTGTSDSRKTLVLAPTAYNWLNTHIEPKRAAALGHDAQNPFFVIEALNGPTRDAIYAALCSHVALWCWRTFGDGFHVSRALLSQVPMPPVEDSEEVARLGKLGRELWGRVGARPIVSTNGGRRTVAFPANRVPDADALIDEIDRLLLDHAGLSHPRVNLRQWAKDLAAAGREHERTAPVRWSVQT